MLNMKRLKKTTVMMITLFLLLAALIPNLEPAAKAAEVTSAAGIVSASAGQLNVRAEASSDSQLLTALPKGSYVTLLWKTGSWWRIEYAASQYGYVSASYINYVYGTYAVKTSVSSGNLNVRTGAATSYPVRSLLPNNKTVLVLSSGGGWSRILYNGTQTGYVSAQYLGSIMAWPVPVSKTINQYYASPSHVGLDIGAAQRGVAGNVVVAAQAGKVVFTGWLNGYGYVAYINSTYNGKPIQTRYAHLQSAPVVAVGSSVSAGQKIGAMGNSGTSTGVHLHFEVRLRSSTADCIANADSRPQNPLTYVG